MEVLVELHLLELMQLQMAAVVVTDVELEAQSQLEMLEHMVL